MVLLVLTRCNKAISQQVIGIIVDEEKPPLEFTSVALLQTKDSLLVQYISTGVDGKFLLLEFNAGTYMLQIYLMTDLLQEKAVKEM